jgi:hypothetical protein
LAGKPKFSEKTCPSATFIHHKIPHDETRVWTRSVALGSRRLTSWRCWILFISKGERGIGSIYVYLLTSQTHVWRQRNKIMCPGTAIGMQEEKGIVCKQLT